MSDGWILLRICIFGFWSKSVRVAIDDLFHRLISLLWMVMVIRASLTVAILAADSPSSKAIAIKFQAFWFLAIANNISWLRSDYERRRNHLSLVFPSRQTKIKRLILLEWLFALWKFDVHLFTKKFWYTKKYFGFFFKVIKFMCSYFLFTIGALFDWALKLTDSHLASCSNGIGDLEIPFTFGEVPGYFSSSKSGSLHSNCSSSAWICYYFSFQGFHFALWAVGNSLNIISIFGE
jgi:hypothetical protein